MKTELEARLKELKEEYRKGQERLLVLDQETTNLSNTMLRISGAIQVIDELLSDDASGNSIPVNNGLEIPKDSEK